jgi:ribosomal protein L37AE/L43A
MALVDLELWNGIHTWCNGYRDGLPWWRWGNAPTGLCTRTQIHTIGRRLARNQDLYGLIVWKRGKRTAGLYRLDLTLPARRKTAALLATVEIMEQARRTCRRCKKKQPYRMPTSTWKCWTCMEKTGDYGEPAAVA